MRGEVCVTGIGISRLGKDTGLTEGQLAVEAARRALADAHLQATDVDGLAMFPYRGSPPSAFSGPDLSHVQRALGINSLRWAQSTTVENGQLGAVVAAVTALLAGLCDHALVYRAHKRQTRRYLPHTTDVSLAYDEDAFTIPYGAGGGSARGALWAARHMHVYGTTQEDFGRVCVNARAHAATNERAVWREPITLDQYLDSRWICTPLKVLDCDYPIDGATALIFSRAGVAGGTRKPVLVDSVGAGPGPSLSWSGWVEKSEMASRYAAESMWSHTSLTPADVDVAELYDGFSYFTLCWLEDLGLVAKGQAGQFFRAGGGPLGSKLPVNTDGGQLGMGRLHGFGKVAEAVAQLRGEAVNQVDGAEVAVATAGGGPGCVSLLLRAGQVR
ncbi:MAG TPA: thiolase family protein [Amycolatopsis sp.]|nr:thiolase family protein [Amycolatopsis sp.]